jgi:hypothetical protein
MLKYFFKLINNFCYINQQSAEQYILRKNPQSEVEVNYWLQQYVNSKNQKFF